MQVKSNNVVFILCGGRGTRMGSLGAACPKVLTKVQNRPMLSHILNQFIDQGFNKFVFATGFLTEQVENFVKAEYPHIEAIFSNAGENASILQRFVYAQKHFSDQVVVCYGDTFIDIDYRKLLSGHINADKMLTVVTSAFQNPFGVVTFDPTTHLVNSFVEKPILHYYIGGMALKKECFANLEPHLLSMPDGQGFVALLQSLIEKKQLNSHPHQGLQVTFNTEGDLKGAELALNSYYTLKEL